MDGDSLYKDLAFRLRDPNDEVLVFAIIRGGAAVTGAGCGVWRGSPCRLSGPQRLPGSWHRRLRAVLMSRAGTPRRRENRGGLPADAGAFLVVEAVESVWRRGLDLDGSRTVLGARGSDFRFPDRGPRAALCVWPTVKVRRRSGDAGAAGDPRRS